MIVEQFAFVAKVYRQPDRLSMASRPPVTKRQVRTVGYHPLTRGALQTDLQALFPTLLPILIRIHLALVI